MSKKSRNRANVSNQIMEPSAMARPEERGVFAYLRNHLWVAGVIVILSLGALGAGLKYLEEDARNAEARNAEARTSVRAYSSRADSSKGLLDSINPFVTAPPPLPTPQLKVEYLYAGSRLLAVEDANANAAPPADLAVWRPSSGTWWVLGGVPGSQQTVQNWGLNGDIPVPGDFDGDGKTDFSIFRPSEGTWYIIHSSTGGSIVAAFGLNGDIPAPADFDGDGKTDRAVFRPSNSHWYILRSSDQALSTIRSVSRETFRPQPITMATAKPTSPSGAAPRQSSIRLEARTTPTKKP